MRTLERHVYTCVQYAESMVADSISGKPLSTPMARIMAKAKALKSTIKPDIIDQNVELIDDRRQESTPAPRYSEA